MSGTNDMKALEIGKRYFYEHCLPMIRQEFPFLEKRIAFGCAGEGSECFGFDDEISRDHDFDIPLCLWLTAEDYGRYGFALSRAYSKLPGTFMGLERQVCAPVGGARRGVLETGAFYSKFLGATHAPCEWRHWLSLPEHALACASNGEVFSDELGEFSTVREKLKRGYPRDVLLKKLASKLLLMAQSGLYNYPRCLRRGELEASRFALYNFTRSALSAVYLLNNSYEPFYKWAFRGALSLEIGREAVNGLSALILGDLSGKDAGEAIAFVCSEICRGAFNAGFSGGEIDDPEALAYLMNDQISDSELRNLHILSGSLRE